MLSLCVSWPGFWQSSSSGLCSLQEVKPLSSLSADGPKCEEGVELDLSLSGFWSLLPLPRSAVFLIYVAFLWFQHQHCSRLLS